MRQMLMAVLAFVCLNALGGTGNRTFVLDRENQTGKPDVWKDAKSLMMHIDSLNLSKATVLVAPSVYWLDDPDDPAVRKPEKGNGVPYAVEMKCDTLEFIGLSDNPEDVVFAVNRGQTQGALGNFTMFHITGKSLRTENITFGNYCNVDLVYPRDTTQNRQRRRDAIVQAQIGWLDGVDRMYASNCRFISRLNLVPMTGARRAFYKNCHFESTDDALTGQAVYLGCTFDWYSGKPFYSTPETGAVFLDCDIHSLTEGVQYFTKVPGPVTVIDTRVTFDSPSYSLKWTRDGSTFVSRQSNVTVNGEPYTIDVTRPEIGIDITDKPLLQAFRLEDEDGVFYNTPNLLGGDDGWDPEGIGERVRRLEKSLGHRLTGIPIAAVLKTEKRELEPKNDRLSVRSTLLRWGGYPAESDGRPKYRVGESLTFVENAPEVYVESQNSKPVTVQNYVTAVYEDGNAAMAEVRIKPYLLDAPSMKSKPRIISAADRQSLRLEYELNAEGEDDSYILWSLTGGRFGNDTVPVVHGRGQSGKDYKLTARDHGCTLLASVSPKTVLTHEGVAVNLKYDRKLAFKGEKGKGNGQASELTTDFADIPIYRRQPGLRGVWCFDTYKPEETAEHKWEAQPVAGWYYGEGVDDATGVGLVQSVRGARLSYLPVEETCGDMTVEMTVAPAKGAGQGFGSATGQYMDICLKFDPQRLNGYALRIERTPENDRAVTFGLVRYEDGKVSPIGERMVSSCYRTPCHIKANISDGKMMAEAWSENPGPENIEKGVYGKVSLSAPVEMTDLNGFCIQHTGSTGSSATMLRDLKIKYRD